MEQKKGNIRKTNFFSHKKNKGQWNEADKGLSELLWAYGHVGCV